MSSHEDERTAVAREMHEEFGQMLAALQLNISLMANEYGDYDKFVVRLSAMEKIVSESIIKAQNMSSGLRPVMLDLLGLSDAIEWHSQKFQRTTGISCKINVIFREEGLSCELSTSVYRIFQEMLNNVTHHADATSVQVEMTDRKGHLVLMVRDNGRGISKCEKDDLHSFGITEMRHRVESYGGKLRIFGIRRRGTALIARIPLTA